MSNQTTLNGLNEAQTVKRYWCAVACREHVKLGLSGGFAQACHGKKSPLERMKPNDGIVYYSPTYVMGKGNPKCQMFTSIGLIKDERVYPFKTASGFITYRRDIEYFDAEDVPIHSLLKYLTFTRDHKSWGYFFRFGFFEIKPDDFVTIFAAMNPTMCASRYSSMTSLESSSEKGESPNEKTTLDIERSD